MGQKEEIAQEMSFLVPTFIRHMFPYVFSPMDLPPSQVIALVAICEHERCTLTQLREEMHVSAPTVTGIVNRLERDGYLKRQASEKDRRVTYVLLTDKGEKLIKVFRENIRKRWFHVLSKMPVLFAMTLIKSLRRITQGFKDGTI